MMPKNEDSKKKAVNTSNAIKEPSIQFIISNEEVESTCPTDFNGIIEAITDDDDAKSKENYFLKNN